MSYDCIVKRNIDDYYLVFLQGESKSLTSVKPYLNSQGGMKLENDRFIMYSINGKDKDGNNCKYNIRIKKDHLKTFQSIIEDFDSRCKVQNKVKKINWKRLAVIGMSIVLLVSTPGIIKATKDALKEEKEDWERRNSAPDYAYDNPNLNPELDRYTREVRKSQKKELEEERYHLLLEAALNGNVDALRDLKTAALSGNDVAQDELANYLFETSFENYKGNYK